LKILKILNGFSKVKFRKNSSRLGLSIIKIDALLRLFVKRASHPAHSLKNSRRTLRAKNGCGAPRTFSHFAPNWVRCGATMKKVGAAHRTRSVKRWGFQKQGAVRLKIVKVRGAMSKVRHPAFQ